MNLNSRNIKMTGILSVKKYNKDNRLVQELNVPNLVVTVGKEYIASRMIGTSSNVMSHMAIGTSATAPVVGNTTLNSEIARVALDSSARSNSIITYSATFGPGVGTGSVVEAGVLNASSSGTLLCHTTFPVVNKDSGETIVITWNISVG